VRSTGLVLPLLFVDEPPQTAQPLWTLQFERVPARVGLSVSDSSPAWRAVLETEEIETPWGRVVLSSDRVCRIIMPGRAGLGVLLHLALGGILRRTRRLQVHAAALCPQQSSHTLLFVGPSGAGKTTLALNLARSGWRFLSDDSVVLTETGGGFHATAVRPGFRIGREGRAAKDLLDPDEEFPAQRLRSAPVGVVVFIEQSGAPTSSLSPLSRAEAFARLPAATPEFGPGEEARWQLGVIARLAGLPSFVLNAGRDVLSERGDVALLLRDVLFAARAA